MEPDVKLTPKQVSWIENRRKWYHFYLFLGVGINFLLYFTKPGGFDPSENVLQGALFGFGIPMACMLMGTWIHQKVLGL
ncbi:MAG: hypothetical protein GY874_14750 [Desulfobacteraceae bacterium]|nr:hypothetical protein [Desulfobacteraceae bacterium]